MPQFSLKNIPPDRSFKCFINCLASCDGLLKKILGKPSQKLFHLLANQMRWPHCGSDTQQRCICNCQTRSVMHCKLHCDFHFLFHAAAVHTKQIRVDYDLRNSTDSLTWFSKRLNKVVAQYESLCVRRLRGWPRVFLFIEIVVKWRCDVAVYSI